MWRGGGGGNPRKNKEGRCPPLFRLRGGGVGKGSPFFTESAIRIESAMRIESLIAGGAAAGGVVSVAALSAFEQAATAITAATRAKRFILFLLERSGLSRAALVRGRLTRVLVAGLT